MHLFFMAGCIGGGVLKLKSMGTRVRQFRVNFDPVLKADPKSTRRESSMTKVCKKCHSACKSKTAR